MTATKEVSVVEQPPVSLQPADKGQDPHSSPVSPMAVSQSTASNSIDLCAVSYPSRIFLSICSGSTRPLSSAVMKLGGDVCSIDVLLCTDHDLLNDEFYLDLIRLAASGRIGCVACSPSCNELGVLKLKSGGPPALRSHEFLDGFPNLDADELAKVQNSLMLSRCTELLQVVCSAGGHGRLFASSCEPLTAMACVCVRMHLDL